jgi:hypothetical protein
MALPVALRLVSLSGKGRDFPTKPEISRRITSSIEFNVKSDYKRLERRLNAIERKQLPFAFANTLNDTAFQVRKQIVGPTYDRAFEVRDKRFASQSFRVVKANKRNLRAMVMQVPPRGATGVRGNLHLHAKGGIKSARAGNLAIPSDKIKHRRRSRGVPKNLEPRELLNQPRSFVAVMKSGKRGIFKRRGKKRLPIDLMYSFEKSVVITKQYLFFEDGTMIVRNNLSRNFNKQFARALKTARR